MFPFSQNRSTIAAVSNRVFWNAADATPRISLSNGNLTATLSATPQGGVRATKSIQGFDAFFEFLPLTIGNSSIDGGFALASKNLGSGYIGSGIDSVGIEVQAGRIYKCYNGIFDDIGPFNNQNLAVLFRSSDKTFYAYSNGSLIAQILTTISGDVYPASMFYRADTSITANFGASAFSNPVPSGAIAVNSVP
jgi:hypothetical protein